MLLLPFCIFILFVVIFLAKIHDFISLGVSYGFPSRIAHWYVIYSLNVLLSSFLTMANMLNLGKLLVRNFAFSKCSWNI